MPRKILFVCTGNTCRSPMAAAAANASARKNFEGLPDAVRESLVPEIDASSAGLYANDGEPIAENAKRALEDAGIEPTPGSDYRTHTAHTLTDGEAENADLIVGMSPSHVMELMMRYPAYAEKITGMPEAIPDPYGGDLATYKTCLERIVKGVGTLLSGTEAQK